MIASTDAASTTETKSVRERLIDAAEGCLRAKGIRATTVSEVAEAAGVSRGCVRPHSLTAIPSNAATTVKPIIAERIENWRRKRSTPTPAKAKVRAGYQIGKNVSGPTTPNAP